jgi:hypothetical protein
MVHDFPRRRDGSLLPYHRPPQLRYIQYVTTDGQTFVHEEKRHLSTRIERSDRHALRFRFTNSDVGGRYALVNDVIASSGGGPANTSSRSRMSLPTAAISITVAAACCCRTRQDVSGRVHRVSLDSLRRGESDFYLFFS